MDKLFLIILFFCILFCGVIISMKSLNKRDNVEYDENIEKRYFYKNKKDKY